MTELRCRKTLEEEKEEDDTQGESKLHPASTVFFFYFSFDNFAVSFLCTNISLTFFVKNVC